ncbi:hypothetical protein [Streptomyces atratus]|uniref:hypothetical protein n=1 Tax=Streptomyces atratus TaxID=1893 RepID=UPI00166F83CE|nr:hypothetical protein [Streptomyces atratus]
MAKLGFAALSAELAQARQAHAHALAVAAAEHGGALSGVCGRSGFREAVRALVQGSHQGADLDAAVPSSFADSRPSASRRTTSASGLRPPPPWSAASQP